MTDERCRFAGSDRARVVVGQARRMLAATFRAIAGVCAALAAASETGVCWYIRLNERLFRRLSAQVRRIPGAQRFDDWCNAKEQAWRRRQVRRHAPEYLMLARRLRSVGLDDSAEELESLVALGREDA